MNAPVPADADLPRDPEAMVQFLDKLTFSDEPAELPPPLTGGTMVVRSLRIESDVDARVRAVAAERNVPPTTLMREWIAAGLRTYEHSGQGDPFDELGRLLGEANRAYQVIAHRHAD